MKRRSLLFSTGLLILGVVLIISQADARTGLGQQSDCDVRLGSGQSVQTAIDDADEGSVICLEAGEFFDNILTSKALTLRGAGLDEDGNWLTVIKSAEPGTAVFVVSNAGRTFDVALEDLEMTGAERFSDDQLCASEDQQTVCPDGVVINGHINATLHNVRISGNADDGLNLLGGSATVENSVIESSGDLGIFQLGFTEYGAANLILSDSQVRDNGADGSIMIGPGKLEFVASIFSGNGDDGIGLIGSFSQEITISQNEVFENAGEGIYLEGADVEYVIEHNNIRRNGGCGIRSLESISPIGAGNSIRDNGAADLCGDLEATLRTPLIPEAGETELAVPSDFNSIQEAVDAIAPGGRILVSEGEFSGSLTLWKPVEILGSGAAITTVRGMISLIGSAQDIRLSDLEITGSPSTGLLLHGDANAEAQSIRVAFNSTIGISILDRTQLTLEDSLVDNNGQHPGCNEFCHGILLRAQSSIFVSNSQLEDNNGWGLATYLEQCGYNQNDFSGEVELSNAAASGNVAGGFCTP